MHAQDLHPYLCVYCLDLLVLLCFACCRPLLGGARGSGYTAVGDNKGCCFKKSPKMATFQLCEGLCRRGVVSLYKTMSASQDYSVPIIDSILHPSDFSAAGEVAFAHALKAALIAKSQLTVMHASPSMTASGQISLAYETLARWGYSRRIVRVRRCRRLALTSGKSSPTTMIRSSLYWRFSSDTRQT